MSDDKKAKRLVKQIQQGNNNAYGSLYDMFIEKIYRYIYFRVNTTEDAQVFCVVNWGDFI